MAGKKLARLEIHLGANGGHSVHHYFKAGASKSGAFTQHHEPEVHHFGPEQGEEMLAHVANHLGIEGGEAE